MSINEMKIWGVITAIALLIVMIALIIADEIKNPITHPQEPVVVLDGCSYYEYYHSRRTEHYEYVHCSFCTNIQHRLERK